MAKQLSLDKKTKDQFWNIVEDCLVELYKVPRGEAHRRRQDLREKIEYTPDETMKKAFGRREDCMSDIFYHEEPLYVAEDIAKGKMLEEIEKSGLFDNKTKKELSNIISESRTPELFEIKIGQVYESIRAKYNW